MKPHFNLSYVVLATDGSVKQAGGSITSPGFQPTPDVAGSTTSDMIAVPAGATRGRFTAIGSGHYVAVSHSSGLVQASPGTGVFVPEGETVLLTLGTDNYISTVAADF